MCTDRAVSDVTTGGVGGVLYRSRPCWPGGVGKGGFSAVVRVAQKTHPFSLPCFQPLEERPRQSPQVLPSSRGGWGSAPTPSTCSLLPLCPPRTPVTQASPPLLPEPGVLPAAPLFRCAAPSLSPLLSEPSRGRHLWCPRAGAGAQWGLGILGSTRMPSCPRVSGGQEVVVTFGTEHSGKSGAASSPLRGLSGGRRKANRGPRDCPYGACGGLGSRSQEVEEGATEWRGSPRAAWRVRGRQCPEGSQAWTACGVSGAHLLGWEGGCGSTLRGLPGVTAPGVVSQDQVAMEALAPKAREWGEDGSRPSGLRSREKRGLGPGRTRELAEIGGRGRAPVRKAPGARVDMDPKSTLWKGPKLLVISVSVWVPGGCGADGLGRGGAALPESWLGEGRWGQQREEGVWVVAGKEVLV